MIRCVRMWTGEDGDSLFEEGWQDRLKTIIPTYGIDLIQDAAACRDIRAQTAAVLGLTNI
jgi:malate dehydrogenase (quinone)